MKYTFFVALVSLTLVACGSVSPTENASSAIKTEVAATVVAEITAAAPTIDYPATIEFLNARIATTEPSVAPTATEVPQRPTLAPTSAPTLAPTVPPVSITTPLPPTAAAATAIRDMYICASPAVVRKGASDDAEIDGLFSEGTTFSYYNKEGEWFYLGQEDGVKFYVHQSFVCPLSQKPPPTADMCQGYSLPDTNFILRYTPGMKPVRGITRPNGIQVYYDISDAEFWEGQGGGMREFNCPAEAEANGYADGKP